jgi:hypothetical protein
MTDEADKLPVGDRKRDTVNGYLFKGSLPDIISVS